MATRIEINVTTAPGPPPTITISAGPYTELVDISVSFTGAMSTRDWIGFYAAGAALNDYHHWIYHHNPRTTSGTSSRREQSS